MTVERSVEEAPPAGQLAVWWGKAQLLGNRWTLSGHRVSIDLVERQVTVAKLTSRRRSQTHLARTFGS